MAHSIRNFKYFSIPAACLAIGLITLLVYAASLHKKSKNAERRPYTNISVDGFSITKYSKDGANKLLTLSGKRLEPGPKKLGPFYVSALRELVIKDAKMEFYDDGRITATIVSGKAILMSRSFDPAGKQDLGDILPERVKFLDRPCLVTEDRRALASEVLWWDDATGAVRAEDGCVLTYELGRLRADRIDSDIYLKNFSCDERKIPLKRLIGMSLKRLGG